MDILTELDVVKKNKKTHKFMTNRIIFLCFNVLLIKLSGCMCENKQPPYFSQKTKKIS